MSFVLLVFGLVFFLLFRKVRKESKIGKKYIHFPGFYVPATEIKFLKSVTILFFVSGLCVFIYEFELFEFLKLRWPTWILAGVLIGIYYTIKPDVKRTWQKVQAPH